MAVLELKQRGSFNIYSFLKRELKWGDVLILFFFFCISASSFFYIYAKDKGQYFKVIVLGENIGTFSLLKNTVKPINVKIGTITLEVRDREVFVKKAPCRGKICMEMGSIGKDGDVIACVPSGVIIEVIGGNGIDRKLDGITK